VRGQARGHAAVHAHARGHAGRAHASAAAAPIQIHGVADSVLRFVPEPHLIFSLLALFGAVGNVLQRTLHLPVATAALGAGAIAAVLQWLIVARLWRFAFSFTGQPTSPLASLVMEPAEAVTTFHNDRGIVRAVLDGRAVQLSAELVADESGLPVQVGDRLTIQEVDPEHEHVHVSVR
jgi:hypothetical protein